MKERNNQNVESEVIQHWSTVVYAYVREIQLAERSRESWDPCKLLVDAAYGFWMGKGRAIEGLLAKSREALGFEDPLTLRFDLHRWLAADREEAYSDWLAWIVNELQAGERVGQLLFGNRVPVEIWNCHERCIADRETRVPEGQQGHEGRTDCVIRFGNAAVILIEAKLTDIRSADLGALSGYKNWLDGEPYDFKKALLLVTDASGEKDRDGFDVIEWRDVCFNLRRILPGLIRQASLITAALSAAFVGAVEMNLLGLPPLRWGNGKSEDQIVGEVSLLGSRADEVIEHLKATFV